MGNPTLQQDTGHNKSSFGQIKKDHILPNVVDALTEIAENGYVLMMPPKD